MPLVAPTVKLTAAPKAFRAVAFVFNSANVAWLVVRYPPLMSALPCTVRPPLRPPAAVGVVAVISTLPLTTEIVAPVVIPYSVLTLPKRRFAQVLAVTAP